MFTGLGQLIGRRPWLLVLVWVLAVAAGVVWATLAKPVPPADVGSFLPYNSPHNKAMRLIQEAFPKLAARSQIAVIAYRPGKLTDADFAWLGQLAQKAGEATEGRVLSPTVAFLQPRLVSNDGESAMLVVNLSSNFISPKAVESVQVVEGIISGDGPPAGLTVEITGTAGIGRDYARATQQALHHTTWVTIFAVLIILIVIYRSPVGALVPLVSIGASVYLAFVLLALLSRAGWQISDTERIFAVVLLFGAGVDYAMFWISRYRENLRDGAAFEPAALTATQRCGPAIVASAATTICGLTTMLATDLVPTQSAGKVLAAVLIVSLLAALTLSPSVARILGRWLFWPISSQAQPSIGQRYFWPPLANLVTRRPWAVLLTGTVVLGTLFLLSLRIHFRFDSLSELPEGSSSSRGFAIACRHFSKGQLYSNTVLLKFDDLPDDPQSVSREVAKSLSQIDGVYDVYSLDAPLGQARKSGNVPVGKMLSLLTQEFYLAKEKGVLRFEVLVDHLPFSFEAMDIIDQVQALAEKSIGGHSRENGNLSVIPAKAGIQSPGHSRETRPVPDPEYSDRREYSRGSENPALVASPSGGLVEILMSGPTPYVIAVRQIADKDQFMVMVLATAVIALIVLVLVRDLPLTVFMLLATWLTYGATLTISQYFFVEVLGKPGLDWKVRLIVFVIVVAGIK